MFVSLRYLWAKITTVATRMAGKEPSEAYSTGICDIFSHPSLKPIGQPEPYKHGDDFYQFCDRFTEFVRLHEISKKLDLLLLSFVDDRSHATLKTVHLEDGDKLCPVKLCDAYKRAMNPGLVNGDLIAQLFTMKQENRESIDDFSYRIRKIAQKMTADENTVNSHKLEAFILGMHSVHIKVELIKCENISFEQAVTKARKLEQIIKGSSNLSAPVDGQSCDKIDSDSKSDDSYQGWSTINRSRARHRRNDYKSKSRSKMRPKYNSRSFSRERSYQTNLRCPKKNGSRSTKVSRNSRDDDLWCPFRQNGKKSYYSANSSSSESEHLN